MADPAPIAWPERINLREIKESAGREARMLGVDPKTLRSRLKEIGLSRL